MVEKFMDTGKWLGPVIVEVHDFQCVRARLTGLSAVPPRFWPRGRRRSDCRWREGRGTEDSPIPHWTIGWARDHRRIGNTRKGFRCEAISLLLRIGMSRDGKYDKLISN